jgi:hypothetical protein
LGLSFLCSAQNLPPSTKRFDDMRILWRAELRRVEEALQAHLKHIEERG